MAWHMSYMAMNRIVESRASADEAYRRKLGNRPVLSMGRAMSDEALLMKLRILGFEVERPQLQQRFSKFVSAQDLAKTMIRNAQFDIPEAETDWVWIALTCLWERWSPSLPNAEIIDDKMQAGYAALREKNTPEACRIWLETWGGCPRYHGAGGYSVIGRVRRGIWRYPECFQLGPGSGTGVAQRGS